MKEDEKSNSPCSKRDRSPKDSRPPKRSRLDEFSRPALDDRPLDGREYEDDRNDYNGEQE